MCVTLNEGYLREIKRGSTNLNRYLIKIYHSTFNDRTIFLVCLFPVFLRLQIYENIKGLITSYIKIEPQNVTKFKIQI